MKRMIVTARGAGKRFLPLNVRRALGRVSPSTRTKIVNTIALSDADWSATRAFAIPLAEGAQIRVNLAGREPEGIVHPGAAYERLLSEISDVVTEIVDDDTGVSLVESVVRVGDMIGGPVGDVLPDLVIKWKPESPRRVRSPLLGVFDVSTTDLRSGQHNDTGFLMGTGPGIAPSGRPELSSEVRSLIDIAPTVLSRLGLREPSLPGRPIELFGA
jgi:predicted AlkP superfamily phosphohydrolase/phosphomutase